MSLRSLLLLVAVALGGSASVAQAQYFGQNKVQYEKFDFKVKARETASRNDAGLCPFRSLTARL